MCGRAAQTQGAVGIAASAMGLPFSKPSAAAASTGGVGGPDDHDASSTTNTSPDKSFPPRDNYNLSPGMDAVVFWRDPLEGKVNVDRKVWGLVTKGGSQSKPLPSDNKERMAMHFSNLMYNARSDTLYTKPTFSKLALQGKTCVVALDGYFEWKPSPIPGDKGKKQPYFVKSANGEYLLMAGLWTKVTTGLEDEPFLETFTILTTEAHEQIRWLHHRMPMCIWDISLAQKWLHEPSKMVHDALDIAAHKAPSPFNWHKVTANMGSVKFRGKEAIEPLPEMKTVASFFQVKQSPSSKGKSANDTEKDGGSLKRSLADTSDSPKKKKPSTIANFFTPAKGGTESSSSASAATTTIKPKSSPKPSNKKKGPLDSFFTKPKEK
jgi:putative SOS response-associated peptidase YedK